METYTIILFEIGYFKDLFCDVWDPKVLEVRFFPFNRILSDLGMSAKPKTPYMSCCHHSNQITVSSICVMKC